MKFVLSYSSGKDCMLALHRMVKSGNIPIALIITIKKELNLSCFHGVSNDILNEVSKSLNIPILKGEVSNNNYNEVIETLLKKAKKLGAKACVFGDIDIEDHKIWGETRCLNVGMKALFPLWGEPREKLVFETIESGFKSVIKCVNNKILSKKLLGKILTVKTVNEIRNSGSDLCGENGEYHTVVLDAPLFKYPVKYKLGKIINIDSTSAIEIKAEI